MRCHHDAQVQTNGKKTPLAAVEDALTALADEYSDIQEQFMVRCCDVLMAVWHRRWLVAAGRLQGPYKAKWAVLQTRSVLPYMLKMLCCHCAAASDGQGSRRIYILTRGCEGRATAARRVGHAARWAVIGLTVAKSVRTPHLIHSGSRGTCKSQL